jgi:hypothetical protein
MVYISNIGEIKVKHKRKELPKERNPFVQHLLNRRGGGIHQKSKKATRRLEKSQLKKECFGRVAA